MKLWYAYHQWYASECSVVHGLSKERSKHNKSFNKCNYIENSVKLFFIQTYKIIISGIFNVLNYL
jgi:hypothetical protein